MGKQSIEALVKAALGEGPQEPRPQPAPPRVLYSDEDLSLRLRNTALWRLEVAALEEAEVAFHEAGKEWAEAVMTAREELQAEWAAHSYKDVAYWFEHGMNRIINTPEIIDARVRSMMGTAQLFAEEPV